MYRQADIVVVKFPFTDGSEFKKRPVMILSNHKVNKTGDYLVVQITSKSNTDGLSVAIDANDCLNGLPLKSYIRIHKLFTIHKSLILSKLTSVHAPFFKNTVVEIVKLLES
jgi:mRNA interferase MazF